MVRRQWDGWLCRTTFHPRPTPVPHVTGLALRKAAFAAMDTILAAESLSDRVGAEFVPLLCSGLRDEEDVKLLCHTLLCKLTLSPTWQALIVAEVPPIAAALSSALSGKDAAGKDSSSADVVRSALRTVDTLARNCPDALTVPAFAEVMDRCERRDASLAAMLAAIRGEAGKF